MLTLISLQGTVEGGKKRQYGFFNIREEIQKNFNYQLSSSTQDRQLRRSISQLVVLRHEPRGDKEKTINITFKCPKTC